MQNRQNMWRGGWGDALSAAGKSHHGMAIGTEEENAFGPRKLELGETESSNPIHPNKGCQTMPGEGVPWECCVALLYLLVGSVTTQIKEK